jgi:signal transduction histidine kinase
VRRWRTASAALRSALMPVLLTGVLTAFLLGLSLLGDVTGVHVAEDLIDVLAAATMASVPFAFLVGLLHSRLSRASAVSDLVARLAEAGRRRGLRDALAEALGDPSLWLAYWVPEQQRYVDAGGHPVELPARGGSEACTPVEHEGRSVAMICHDAMLETEPELVQTVAAAAGLALENEQLDAELRARVEELRASRARIVQAAEEERRRLERDLHDGAQQRLVSLALNLRLASAKIESEPESAKALMDETSRELGEATTELRELARGLHPAVLSDRGLHPALEALAGRAPLPVELAGPPPGGLPPAVESASYFVVAEALTNVARYADASHAEVRVSRANGRVEVEVRDDGVGGADPAAGSGLRGLADRVAALDGRFEVVSPQGEGTVVRAVIPCA